MTTILSGPIFSKLNAAGDYGPDLQDVATKTVSQLLEIETHANAPGMLLGMGVDLIVRRISA